MRRRAGAVITTVAVVLLVLHWVFPQLQFDAVSFVCIVLALTPWLASVVKSVEAPGLKIEMREMEELEAEAVEVTLRREQEQAEHERSGVGRPPAAPAAHAPDAPASAPAPRAESTVRSQRAEAPTDELDDDPQLAMAQVQEQLHRALDRAARASGLEGRELPMLPLVVLLEQHGALTPYAAHVLKRTVRFLERAAQSDADPPEASAAWVRRMRRHLLGWLEPGEVADRVAAARADATFS